MVDLHSDISLAEYVDVVLADRLNHSGYCVCVVLARFHWSIVFQNETTFPKSLLIPNADLLFFFMAFVLVVNRGCLDFMKSFFVDVRWRHVCTKQIKIIQGLFVFYPCAAAFCRSQIFPHTPCVSSLSNEK